MSLKTNYQNSAYLGNKKFKMTNNSDGTVELKDVTSYVTIGEFSAKDINEQNKECNATVETYKFIDSIIAKLRSKGYTMTNTSPAAIISTLNSINSTAYNAGVAAGKKDVQNNPYNYGFVTQQDYNNAQIALSTATMAYNTAVANRTTAENNKTAATQANNNIRTKVNNAMSDISTAISWSSPREEWRYSPQYDPISASDANSIKTEIAYHFNDVHDTYSPVATSMNNILTTTINRLS